MKEKKLQKINNFVIFKTNEGKVNIDVFFVNDNLWLTQKVMAELFGTTKQNVSLHIRNIFKELELEENSVVEESSIVQIEGGRSLSRKY
jgi:hypothetical protein